MTDTVEVQDHQVDRAQRPVVLHIITALGTGGAERQLESLARHGKHPVCTIALYSGGPIGDAMTTAGEQVEVLGMSGIRRLSAPLRLAWRIRRHRPDVVHVHLLAGQLWGIPAARLAGVRTVVSSEHSLMDDSIENRPLTPRLRRLYLMLERMSSRTVAVSDTTRDRLVRWGVRADRISVVDNGIDFAALRFSAVGRARIRRELGVTTAATVVGAVGRLEAVKRFGPALSALASWLLAGDRHLVIAGDGALRGELAELASSLGVADRVHLLGPRTDIPDLLSAFDVLISPSRDETFGMAVIEALGNGLPVVYAQCPAIGELARRPAAAFLLVPVDDSATAERQAILDGVVSALSAAQAVPECQETAGRFAADQEVETMYGIEKAVMEMDRVYSLTSGDRY